MVERAKVPGGRPAGATWNRVDQASSMLGSAKASSADSGGAVACPIDRSKQ